jgi:hypothetical protein
VLKNLTGRKENESRLFFAQDPFMNHEAKQSTYKKFWIFTIGNCTKS